MDIRIVPIRHGRRRRTFKNSDQWGLRYSAGVVVVAGTQPVGGFSINPLDGNTYGALLLSISGVAGSEQLFPTNVANGLGGSSPPTSLFLSSTPLPDFCSFSEVNPTLTFVMSDSLFTDNSGSFSVASPVASAVPEISTWAMMILGFTGIGFLTYRRRKGAALAA